MDVLIDSEGGSINAGMLIYDVIQTSKAPIRTWCIGRAYSMAAVLLACGNHGRYILPHGEVLLHEPLLQNRVGGSSSSIKAISDSLIEAKQKLNHILVKHTRQSKEAVEMAASYDHFYGARESVEFGLADDVVDFSKLLEEM